MRCHCLAGMHIRLALRSRQSAVVSSSLVHGSSCADQLMMIFGLPCCSYVMGQLTGEFQQLSQRVIALEAALREQGSADLAALLRTVQVRHADCCGLACRVWIGWCAGRSPVGRAMFSCPAVSSSTGSFSASCASVQHLLLPFPSERRTTSVRSCGSHWRCMPSSRRMPSAASGAGLGPGWGAAVAKWHGPAAARCLQLVSAGESLPFA